MANVIVISGANGAGKSTLAPFLLRDTFNILEYVNADTIAEGLSAFAPEKAAFDAGKVMLRRLKELAADGKDFAFETTLSGRFYAGWLSDLQSRNYRFHIVFLWLRNSELAVERVRSRVLLGGHDIPVDIIKRRYEKGLQNFFSLYQPIADSWQLFDASDSKPELIAYGGKIKGEIVENNRLWKQIKN